MYVWSDMERETDQHACVQKRMLSQERERESERERPVALDPKDP